MVGKKIMKVLAMMNDGDLAGDHPFCAAGNFDNVPNGVPASLGTGKSKFISLHHFISQKALLLRRTFL